MHRRDDSDDAPGGSETQGARLATDATPTVEHPAIWDPSSEATWAPVSALAHRASAQWSPQQWSAEHGATVTRGARS